jgi:hypothetical protein
LALLPVERLIPEPLPASVSALRVLSLINPALLVLLAAWIGTSLAPRIGLDAPALRSALTGVSPAPVLLRQARLAVWAGLAIGLLLAGYSIAIGPFLQSLDAEATSRLQALTPPIPTRLLYGGITEEVIARWGVMTLAAWTAWRIVGRSVRPPVGVYWFGNLAAALVFALAHLPFLFGVIGDPPVWLPLAALAVNGVAGVVFGWLFWRLGLEAAMIAHVLAHVAAVLVGLATA